MREEMSSSSVGQVSIQGGDILHENIENQLRLGMVLHLAHESVVVVVLYIKNI